MVRPVLALALTLLALEGTALSGQTIKKTPAHSAPAKAAPARSSAKAPADTGNTTGDSVVVTGFVLDSLRNLPLAGATVLIANTTYSATTDVAGRFRFVVHGLADGVYKVGFFHPTLDSLGITPPTRPLVIQGGKASFLELSVPSAHTVVAAVCPDSSLTNGRGLVMGIIRDAGTSAPMNGVRVVLMWTGIAVGNTAVVKVPQATSVLTSSDGTFRACGVPTTTRVTMQARGPTGSSGWIELTVPGTGLAFRDVLLGERPVVAVAPALATARGATDTGATARPPAPLGTALLAGHVTAADGHPLEGAMVLLLGTRISARSDVDGAFRLTGLPAGTQSVEIREIGYSPKRFAVDLAPHRQSQLTAALDERTTVLKTIEVTAKAGSDIPGFAQRRKSGLGFYMDQDQLDKVGAITTTDLFRTVPGVQVVWDGSAYSVQVGRNSTTGSCPVQWYIDGAPFLAVGDDIDQIVQPQDIAAIEVYKSSAETPIQFQGAGGSPCGTIVVWTKRARAPSKDKGAPQ